ncbi:MAG: hypothetical protein ACYTBJ_21995 [Planctomycetota bacterium]|jgi:hypothetical protein
MSNAAVFGPSLHLALINTDGTVTVDLSSITSTFFEVEIDATATPAQVYFTVPSSYGTAAPAVVVPGVLSTTPEAGSAFLSTQLMRVVKRSFPNGGSIKFETDSTVSLNIRIQGAAPYEV